MAEDPGTVVDSGAIVERLELKWRVLVRLLGREVLGARVEREREGERCCLVYPAVTTSRGEKAMQVAVGGTNNESQTGAGVESVCTTSDLDDGVSLLSGCIER